MFVTLRTLFYFAFNVINALCLLHCLSDANNFDVCYIWRTRLYIEGVWPRPFTCGKVGELKRIYNKLRVFDLGHLLVVKLGNLNELTS